MTHTSFDDKHHSENSDGGAGGAEESGGARKMRFRLADYSGSYTAVLHSDWREAAASQRLGCEEARSLQRYSQWGKGDRSWSYERIALFLAIDNVCTKLVQCAAHYSSVGRALDCNV